MAQVQGTKRFKNEIGPSRGNLLLVMGNIAAFMGSGISCRRLISCLRITLFMPIPSSLSSISMVRDQNTFSFVFRSAIFFSSFVHMSRAFEISKLLLPTAWSGGFHQTLRSWSFCTPLFIILECMASSIKASSLVWIARAAQVKTSWDESPDFMTICGFQKQKMRVWLVYVSKYVFHKATNFVAALRLQFTCALPMQSRENNRYAWRTLSIAPVESKREEHQEISKWDPAPNAA
jgi:hypothetical protein